MKIRFLLLTCVFFAFAKASAAGGKSATKLSAQSAVAAAPVQTSTIEKSQAGIINVPEVLKNKLSAAAYFINSNNINSNSASINGSEIGFVKYNTTAGLGLQVQYTDYIAARNVKWFSSFSTEQTHEMTDVSADGSNGYFSLNERSSYRPFVLAGGLTFLPSDRFYIPVGLNYVPYTEVHTGAFADLHFNGDLGWQAAVGMKSGNDVAVEIGWRELAYKMTASLRNGTPINFGKTTIGGLQISGRYTF